MIYSNNLVSEIYLSLMCKPYLLHFINSWLLWSCTTSPCVGNVNLLPVYITPLCAVCVYLWSHQNLTVLHAILVTAVFSWTGNDTWSIHVHTHILNQLLTLRMWGEEVKVIEGRADVGDLQSPTVIVFLEHCPQFPGYRQRKPFLMSSRQLSLSFLNTAHSSLVTNKENHS